MTPSAASPGLSTWPPLTTTDGVFRRAAFSGCRRVGRCRRRAKQTGRVLPRKEPATKRRGRAARECGRPVTRWRRQKAPSLTSDPRAIGHRRRRLTERRCVVRWQRARDASDAAGAGARPASAGHLRRMSPVRLGAGAAARLCAVGVSLPVYAVSSSSLAACPASGRTGSVRLSLEPSRTDPSRPVLSGPGRTAQRHRWRACQPGPRRRAVRAASPARRSVWPIVALL